MDRNIQDKSLVNFTKTNIQSTPSICTPYSSLKNDRDELLLRIEAVNKSIDATKVKYIQKKKREREDPI